MNKYELDRILENNQTGMRMKQAQQLLKVAAEVALLAASGGSSAVLKKAAGGAVKAASGAGGKLIINKTLTETIRTGLKEGTKGLGKMAFEQGKNKVIRKVGNTIKEQLPDGTVTALDIALNLDKKKGNTKNILETFKKISSSHDANGLANAVASVVLGEKDLTHGGIGATKKAVGEIKEGTARLEVSNEKQADKVELVKTFFKHDGKTALLINKTPEEIMKKDFIASANLKNGKYALEIAQNYSVVKDLNKLQVAELQTQIKEGREQLNNIIGQTTRDLLKDTQAMLETAKEDAEAGDRSETAIKRMREA